MTAEPAMTVWNCKSISDKSPRSAVELSKQMQKTMLRLKGEFISTDGKGVDYKKIKNSPLYIEYRDEMAPQLQYVVLDNIPENEKKAFFINIYNALTIHGLTELSELPKSVLKVQQFWKKTGYNIGGHVYSLDDIEHGILRGNKSRLVQIESICRRQSKCDSKPEFCFWTGNRPHPASIHPEFKADDPRLKYVVKTFDPRIHFALVCGAKSCPAINVYTAENLESALEAATRSFCAQEVSMFTEVDEIWLSRIFQWYSQDFGNTDVDVIKWTIPYLEKSIQDRAEILLFKLDRIKPVAIKYNEYDWNLNVARPEYDPTEIHPNDLMEMENQEAVTS